MKENYVKIAGSGNCAARSTGTKTYQGSFCYKSYIETHQTSR